MRIVGIGAISRCVGYAAVAAAIVAAVLHFRQQDVKQPDLIGIAAASSTDQLARELAHCEAIGMAARDDPACAAAWAENRRRFFDSALVPDAPVVNAKPGQPQ
ncbi:MAG TPA: putative entry exclusion protein TrbK-alt [Stellaceae bacterium]|nr:putative entry exclusion protein TrbK-alt [Stellaceae bacterium]HUN51279.1 putative entry exclusion protein TrbK-alt [Candidatus Sulfotelmatobacter sp.]